MGTFIYNCKKKKKYQPSHQMHLSHKMLAQLKQQALVVSVKYKLPLQEYNNEHDETPSQILKDN